MSDAELLVYLRVVSRPADMVRRRLIPNISAICGDWLVIVAAIWAVCNSPWWINPLLMMIIACRQHALLVLMHDGSHYMLHPDKRWNDVLADVFCAFPFLITVRTYRARHIPHHDHLNTPRDPDIMRKAGPGSRAQDWLFPANWRQLGRLLLRDISGLALIESVRAIHSFHRAEQTSHQKTGDYPFAGLVRTGFFLTCGALMWATGKPGLVLFAWMVSFCCFLPILLRLRSIAEHFALPRTGILDDSRNVLAPAWERFLLSPHNVNLHLTHHLFPYVPWHQLPELHRRLSAVEQYRTGAYSNSSYLFGVRSVLADVLSVKDDPRMLLASEEAPILDTLVEIER